MSIQNIIDKAQQIEIDRRRIVAQTISRSQRIKTSERSTAQPWRFKVTPPGALKYADSRGILEVIDLGDRVTEYEISLSNTTGMQYITEYRGSLTTGQRNSLTIDTVSTNTITITNLPSVSSSTVMFAVGDYIQPSNSRYPYTVTATCLRGLNTTTTVVVHRNIITSEGITLAGQGLDIGNSVTWRVVVSGLPSYQLIPNRLVQYTGDFELIEKII
jgi:hypothetical protein